MDPTSKRPPPAASSSTTYPPLPKLEILNPSALPSHRFLRPAKRINEGPDVSHFLTSKAYRDIGVWILQLNHALVPRIIKKSTTVSTSEPTTDGQQQQQQQQQRQQKAEEVDEQQQPPPPPPTDALAAKLQLLRKKRDEQQPTTTEEIKTFPLPRYRDGEGVENQEESESIKKLQRLLKKVEAIIDEAPPDPGPRRFGNVSFRTWFKLLEERADGLLREYLPGGVLRWEQGAGGEKKEEEEGTETETETETEGDSDKKTNEQKQEVVGPLEELKAYFLGGFGSAQRLDYGTGHELSFIMFLGGLWKLGGFEGEENDEDGEVERRIVLGVVEPYLRVIRRLILTYTLEPAGSHGVWGLDDHSFVPYIFGSAQYTRPISSPNEPTPLEGSVPNAPKPSDITKPTAVERYRTENMYFSAIGFIYDVKKGPFWEHSPILFDVSGIKDGWGKINKGMIKMYNAEVLSKFPVVQHFPFGSLFQWEKDPEAGVPVQSVHMQNQPVASAAVTGGVGIPTERPSGPGGVTGTAAPWAQAPAQAPAAGIGAGAGMAPPMTAAPWARSTGAGAGAGVGASAANRFTPFKPAGGPGGAPHTGPPPPESFPSGTPGTASNQFAVTKAPWTK
ncbi:PTPA-domain-containing protein [Neurospora crassa]|uniref:Serine/threonine-protein phosphatase 2A activator 1 n=1 Tax=Neurospora crassa (strain ATCC 24698 / 74-OR23-1A / CBS 708.71 / DSM 1257 / FGSC 987) TaxID=367110 RepID=PTPA1_NEUCR|nr:serine/threonine-protein phosphatase 2A activator 1 [Neurospora crassa OR74A]Q7S6M5.1 RecName: Full=Serine/threonine-protein phosphatase 2A activator 1; AltName: Full=Peptidyl-prolyl cis-trans isomerase PTPA-1; Short=PPIase PTPA-1; Short=Rotamase PTPA-1; AltName: Full=Phosphotyrosyl phosphatase activator 1 [Neurospora crassa OR74A]EAA31200.1 serine/threonine-protein phosphatase 2A activator 1 [Neurospora crassa OR74A]KHE89012.1 PTPA-domain-containing protein [Neurospora crassa]|eukprot:XP_960436.1 serine/threonine-protein phosphatase 2A activator 1 [Neurospora crassa OR74A]